MKKMLYKFKKKNRAKTKKMFYETDINLETKLMLYPFL